MRPTCHWIRERHFAVWKHLGHRQLPLAGAFVNVLEWAILLLIERAPHENRCLKNKVFKLKIQSHSSFDEISVVTLVGARRVALAGLLLQNHLATIHVVRQTFAIACHQSVSAQARTGRPIRPRILVLGNVVRKFDFKRSDCKR